MEAFLSKIPYYSGIWAKLTILMKIDDLGVKTPYFDRGEGGC